MSTVSSTLQRFESCRWRMTSSTGASGSAAAAIQGARGATVHELEKDGLSKGLDMR